MAYKIVVANWKMELSYRQTLDEIERHYKALEDLAFYGTQCHIELVLCPSFESLVCVREKLAPFQCSIKLGAQDCSSHERGPYTGQVSAGSLAEIGVAYCIIGHSEQRAYGQTNEEVFKKAQRLIGSSITPIICIGENLEERRNGKTFEVLDQQIDMCAYVYHELCSYMHHAQQPRNLLVAYEPTWAIGTGKVPDEEELRETLAWLTQKLGTHIPLLYGGSLSEATLKKIAQISILHGFIIGQASSNIQRLKNMLKLMLDN